MPTSAETGRGMEGARVEPGRRHAREATELMVKLRRGVTRSTVVLRDLTTHGARIDSIEKMQIDEALTVQLPGLKPKLAFVAWCDGHSVGLEFDKPLCSEVFRDIVFTYGRKDKPSGGEVSAAPLRHAA